MARGAYNTPGHRLSIADDDPTRPSPTRVTSAVNCDHGSVMAITTMYRGIEYRSRLEARWAALFDRIGWTHTYEPFDTDGYIPDFLIHGPQPMLVEVKPAVLEADYRAPIDKVVRGLGPHWQHDILIVGAAPLISTIGNCWGSETVAGLLGDALWTEGDWDFGAAMWNTCGNCGSVAVYHDYQSYCCRPCGCYDGDHYLGASPTGYLAAAWAEACNRVKWYGKPVVA